MKMGGPAGADGVVLAAVVPELDEVPDAAAATP